MRLLVAGVLAIWGGAALAVDCRDETVDGVGYTICDVDATTEDLRLFLRDGDGAPLGTFSAVRDQLASQGKQLIFGMNAGMYHDDRSPVGHYRKDGQDVKDVIVTEGPGNFGMLPNGVFCIAEGRAEVIESTAYADGAGGLCRDATQSGPMLVIDGALHPRFLRDSTSRYVRNGVGVSGDGTRAYFVMSQAPVTFYDFASLFRDHLQVPQALYFDGNISRLYAPQLGRDDLGLRMGPMVGVVAPLD